MSSAVRYQPAGASGIGLITLERPDNRNSMTPELLDAFAVACTAARADADARCIVITGSGKSFSAGADFRSNVQRDGTDPAERSYAMYAPFLGVLDLEVPVVAAMNGHAIGGGFGLALVCDVRVAARGARYGANFVKLGLSPGMAISYLLPRVVGVSRAAELMLTGRLVDGDEAARIGIASECVEPDAVVPRAMAIAAEIAANAPLAVRATKALMYAGLGWDPRAHGRKEAVEQARTVATADAAEGIAALLAKREPVFSGR
jgi:enoyl-CoA hydratase/carnithine racemase